jgi:hypothetical protein
MTQTQRILVKTMTGMMMVIITNSMTTTTTYIGMVMMMMIIMDTPFLGGLFGWYLDCYCFSLADFVYSHFV